MNNNIVIVVLLAIALLLIALIAQLALLLALFLALTLFLALVALVVIVLLPIALACLLHDCIMTLRPYLQRPLPRCLHTVASLWQFRFSANFLQLHAKYCILP